MNSPSDWQSCAVGAWTSSQVHVFAHPETGWAFNEELLVR